MRKKSRAPVAFLWLPRVLALLFVAFISMFALDAFNEPQWFLALVIHLIPSYFLIAFTIISWKHQLLGGLLFVIGGVAMTLFFHSAIIALPAYLIGLLFLISNFYLNKPKRR